MARVEIRAGARRCIRVESDARLTAFLDGDEATLIILEDEKRSIYLILGVDGFKDLLEFTRKTASALRWASSVAAKLGLEAGEYRFIAVGGPLLAKIDAARLAQLKPSLWRLTGGTGSRCAVIGG